MRSFQISADALLRIIEGIVVAQATRAEKNVRGQLSEIDFTADLVLGNRGLSLDPALIQSCRQQILTQFNWTDATADRLAPDTSMQGWVEELSAYIRKSLMIMNFRPAGRGQSDVLCTHRVDALFQDAAAAANLFQGRRRLVSLVSPHSLIGFVLTVLVPALQKIDNLDARRLSPAELENTLAFGDVIVATPSLWAFMIREGMSAPDNIMAASFGEMMSSDLAARMRRRGIGVLRELYGSTENGLVAWRDSSTDTFNLFEHWKKNGEDLQRLQPDGDVRRVSPMDYLTWENDRRFTLGGRRDGAVQIGAVNVFPDYIAGIFEEHALVERCVVRIASTGRGINRLIADITLSSGVRPSETIAREIDWLSRMRLSIQERPHIYNFFNAV